MTDADADSGLPIELHAEGVVLTVHAQPSARSSGLGPLRSGTLKARTTAAPEKGKANEALRRLIAAQLGLRRSQVELLSGTTSSTKRYLLRGASVATVADRLRLLQD
jgi:uncharacterized protein YggU (UPF0235/DUF167 family)